MSNAVVTVAHWFGANVRRNRKAQGLTQEALAERVGIHARYLRALEVGEGSPAFATVVSLAEALEVDVASLFVPAEGEPRKRGRPSGRPAAGKGRGSAGQRRSAKKTGGAEK
jgi:transcriptional regulator with XRE-family HTH domain